MVPWWGWALVAFGGFWSMLILVALVVTGLTAIRREREAADRIHRRRTGL